jgi:hypothetical protein
MCLPYPSGFLLWDLFLLTLYCAHFVADFSRFVAFLHLFLVTVVGYFEEPALVFFAAKMSN